MARRRQVPAQKPGCRSPPAWRPARCAGRVRRNSQAAAPHHILGGQQPATGGRRKRYDRRHAMRESVHVVAKWPPHRAGRCAGFWVKVALQCRPSAGPVAHPLRQPAPHWRNCRRFAPVYRVVLREQQVGHGGGVWPPSPPPPRVTPGLGQASVPATASSATFARQHRSTRANRPARWPAPNQTGRAAGSSRSI